MRVESFTSTNGLTRYILVDSSGVPVDVVLRFLRFKDNCGRARNTLRAYCFHLKSYFEYLEFIGMSFPQIGMDELAGFIRWLPKAEENYVLPCGDSFHMLRPNN